MNILVFPDGTVEWRGERVPCALGRAGVTDNKHEGDGATPAGCFPLRRVFYRPDRCEPPRTVLEVTPLDPLDAWCDDPNDPCYNTFVRQPCRASFELLWRDDSLYDIVVPLGYNDDPVAPGAGSAIFLHIARPDFSPTQGCVAVNRELLLRILAECAAETRLCVRPA
ncbi:MAG: L,D-transpeptidase [Alphaproteobacteria bacterium]